jgi:hypothetical protein
MATVLNQHSSHHLAYPRTTIQKVCIGMGILFLLVGVAGLIMPGMLGMHLSLSHNLIHLASGAISLWCGYSDDPHRSYYFAIGFGVLYGLLGLAGFAFGEPGYPGVGHMEADENLLRVIPNALEFGSSDHGVHILLSLIFLGAAYAASKTINNSISRTTVDVQGRTLGTTSRTPTSDIFRRDDLLNSESDLKDANLGRSDVNRHSDNQRRSDFEGRI